tara:strand:- start:706 stop:909 length:204 start_codon:yes stop_codon:yes gene_type:complete
MTEEEKKKEVLEVCSWTRIKGDAVLRMYAIYKLCTGDNKRYCTKCPDVIRSVFTRLKQYKTKTYNEL